MKQKITIYVSMFSYQLIYIRFDILCIYIMEKITYKYFCFKTKKHFGAKKCVKQIFLTININ